MRRALIAAMAALVVVGLALATAVAPAGASTQNPQWDEWDFVNLINRERYHSGLAPLAQADGVRAVARGWAEAMAGEDTLEHNPDFVRQIGERYPSATRFGENIGTGGAVAQLHSAFMSSEGHRQNILNPGFAYVGIGVVWRGGRLWVAVDFMASGQPAAFLTRTPVTRLWHASPALTSVLVSRRLPAGSAAAVVVASQEGFADALAGGPLAGLNQGPVLLSPAATIPTEVVTEAGRVLRPDGRVYVLGGPRALGAEVEAAFVRAGMAVSRLAGADRFATAAAVAKAQGSRPDTVFVVSGETYPDALSATAPAAALRAPIVLVTRGEVPQPTADYLNAMRPASRLVVGGEAVVPEAVAQAAGMTERVSGPDRYATSEAVARRFFPSAHTVSVVPGGGFTEGLALGPAAARAQMPVILTAPRPTGSTYGYVGGQVARWSSALVIGDPAKIDDAAVVLLFS